MGRDLSAYITENFQKAMDEEYIQAFYQPVIRTVSRQLCSFEALARWIDPEYGVIFPDEFIPVLEANRTIHLLDEYILRQACARIRQTVTEGGIPIPVSVNLSRLDFVLCDIFTEVDSIVREYELPHDFIYFEITESIMAEQKDLMLDIVGKFRDAGYQIWMDDFGSAYSSLNVLKEYSFNEIKMDMGFMRPFNQRSQRIAASVVEMAKSLEIHTLAEGVETEEQVRYMRNIGCEKVQGFFFGRPMPYEDAIAHLRRTGISFELPQDRKYYDDIGLVNVLSAVPFMTKEQRDAITTARQLNSIPLALIEAHEEYFSILFYNSAFERIASGTGMFHVEFTQEMLRTQQPYNNLSKRLVNLLDSTRSGEEGRMNFTSHEDFYEIQAKCIAQSREKYSVLLRMSNLTKASKSLNTGRLDEYLRRIYALYERITLIDLSDDTITPLYIATREQLVSGREGVNGLAAEYAAKYIFPDDRETYLSLINTDTMRERFEKLGRSNMARLLRSNVRHGRYEWKLYNLLQIDVDKYLLMIRDVHDALIDVERRIDEFDKGGMYSAEVLWHNLVTSDLIRIFWKDSDRRFMGASNAFLKYYGFESTDEIIGRNDEDLGWHIHPDQYKNDEIRVLNEGITTHNIPGFCLCDGENKEILASKTPVYNENGDIAGLMGYFIDKDLLTENDRRGHETHRRDMLTGLLNSRGIYEEATAFRDAYYLRGVDFVRIHVSINDFASINEQFGFDFGDKVMNELGWVFKRNFGRTCAVGRYAGHKFVIFRQINDAEEAKDLRARIKALGSGITEVDGIPVTLYLSVGYVLYSEYEDIDEQQKKAELRLLADHDTNISADSRMENAQDIFHLFDDLPLIYGVYHYIPAEDGKKDDALLFYINHAYEEYAREESAYLMTRQIRELYPALQDSWYVNIGRAALNNETTQGYIDPRGDGEIYHYIAKQIIYPGYAAVVYQRSDFNELPADC